MKNNILKRLAERAKNRLLGREVDNYDSNVCIKVINSDDDDFNIRAKQLFVRDENLKSYNPIKMLMDENVLIKLDARGREKYLLETIDKYIKAKNDFQRENKLF